MPQIELKYSGNLSLHAKEIFKSVEALINEIDPSAGMCKSRAFVSDDFLHTHIFLSVMLLEKPHRDSAFMKQLLDELHRTLKPFIPAGCHYSIKLDFSLGYYLTDQH